MSVITENNKDHLLNYEGVEQLLVKINDRFARTDRCATPDTLGMIRAEINTDVNLEDISTGDNHPVQITTDGNAFVNIDIPTSLPANGGDADTVDGKHASDFATSVHTHDRFTSDVVHFDGAIHICNRSGYVYDEESDEEIEHITGIYFSDNVEDNIAGDAYTFIREEGDDRLRVHSNYELKLSTGDTADGNYNIDGPNIRIISNPDDDHGEDETLRHTIQMHAGNGVFVNGSEVAIKSDIPATPMVKGSVNNSAVLDGEYTVNGTKYKNNAISQVSMAIGAASTAGLKGYYYKAIDFANKKIYLSASQPNSIATSGFSAESITCGYNVGDYISIVAYSKFENCSKITAKGSGVITVDSLPFTADDLPSYTLGIGKQPDDFTLYSVNRSINSLTNVMSVKNYDKGSVDIGGGALAEGVQTFATNIGAHSEGIQTHAYGQYSHAEGFRTQAGYAAHAEGKETIASGSRSHAEGQSTVASGDMSHAEGNSTEAVGKYSHVEGYSSSADANASHAEGYSTTASGDSSHAEGWKSTAKGKRSHAEGSETYAGGHYSHTEGLGTKTTNEAEHASGKYNKSTSGSTLFSIGNGISDTNRKNAFEVTSDGNVYIGETIEDNKVATLKDIHASITVDTELDPTSDNPIANSTVANAIKGGVHFAGVINSESVPVLSYDAPGKIIGTWYNYDDEDEPNSKEFNLGDVIILIWNQDEYTREPTKEYILSTEIDSDIGYRWVELGDITPAQEMIDASTLLVKGTGTGSVIVKNRGCIADGQYSTVFGRNGRAYGNYSHVEGRGQGDASSITKENAESSWDSAETSDNTGDNLHLGVGDYAHVEGLNNIAVGNCTHVEGQRNKAKGVSSHAEGWKTQSIGARSHAEGQSTQANGSESHAGGVGSIATGARSFVHGNYVNTTNNDEVAFGKYNNSTTNTIFSVGSGTSNTNRKNAFEVTKTAGYIYDKQIATINDIPTTPSQVGSAPANHNHTITLTGTFIPNVTSSYNDGVLTILGATTNVEYTGTTDVENTNANPESWFVDPEDMTALF